MTKILLISRSEEENMILKRRIEPAVPAMGLTHFLSAHPQGMLASLEDDVSMVVINLPVFKRDHKASVQALRDVGFTGPIIIVAKPETRDCILDVKRIKNVVFVEKPFDLKDLPGIMIKFNQERKVAQRIHRRYPTAQKAEVEFFGTDERTGMTLCNLSKGGAFFHVTRSGVTVGDMVRVTIPLNEMNRTYTMPARVVWVTPAEGMTGVGVEFVGPADVSRQMI